MSLTNLQLCPPPDDVRRPREVQRWVLDWVGRLQDKEIVVGMMTLYQIWLARNDAREDICA
jgi:hypothetical protein